MLGVLFYVELSDRAVALLLGTILLIGIPMRRFLKHKDVGIPRWALAVVAVPYGFLSGTSFGVGMVLAPFLLGAGIFGEQLLATTAVLGLMLNVTKTVAFGISPLLTAELAVLGVAFGVCTIPGHALGRQIVRQTSLRVHTIMLEAFVITGAIYMLWKGWVG